MSVYKSRRKDASAQFIADARELRRMTARAVKRFPSSYRYIVTNGLTTQGNTVLKRLRKVIDSDKDRWRRYQKEKTEATPKPPPKATGGGQHTPPPPPWPPNT